MLFNSVEFAFFFPFIFILYWFVLGKSYKKQNILLFIASYFFYACWDWRFLFLLGFSTILDFVSGHQIFNAKTKHIRKIWLILSTSINLLFLGYFKYYNFFIESFADLLHLVGFEAHYSTLSIILPVGISFYTFHGLSYVFDIYYGRIKPTNSWIDYSLFVSFFPLLVAGPIERAHHLLPQIEKNREINFLKAADGLKQILWGLFKKVVIADGCSNLVNEVFNHPHLYSNSGSTFALAAILFTIQIYGDFSGYSDIALGCARLLGFELLLNFKYPFFSRDIAEFWRRWHVSLTSWFKDYLYIPLGGNKKGMLKTIRNTFIIFLVSGFWHGANWTFLMWGGLNALFIIPSIALRRNRRYLDIVAEKRLFPSLKEIYQLVTTFLLVCFAFIFFRADTIYKAFDFITELRAPSLFTIPQKMPVLLLVLIVFCFVVEWLGRHYKHPLTHVLSKVSIGVRFAFYLVLTFLIFIFHKTDVDFIYFQF